MATVVMERRGDKVTVNVYTPDPKKRCWERGREGYLSSRRIPTISTAGAGRADRRTLIEPGMSFRGTRECSVTALAKLPGDRFTLDDKTKLEFNAGDGLYVVGVFNGYRVDLPFAEEIVAVVHRTPEKVEGAFHCSADSLRAAVQDSCERIA